MFKSLIIRILLYFVNINAYWLDIKIWVLHQDRP